MLKAVSIENLKPGMYVNNVLKQKGQMKIKSKGVVKDGSAISTLQSKGVLEVEVDYSKSNLQEDNKKAPSENQAQKKKASIPSWRANVFCAKDI